MLARNKLILGTIIGLCVGTIFVTIGMLLQYNPDRISRSEIAGKQIRTAHNFPVTYTLYCRWRLNSYVKFFISGIALAIAGLIIVTAYSILLFSVITRKSEYLPEGVLKWCCYFPFVWKCIEQYRQEENITT